MPHPVGIVIGHGCPIGENVTIMQNVTVGVQNLGDSGGPKIGNDVMIGCGAAVLGDVTVGDNAVIAANSVVLSDVPEDTIVAGAPAEPIGKTDETSKV